MIPLDFSSFLRREENEKTSKIHALLDSSGEFVFFFRFDGSIFGAPEESRIVYATMRHPSADEKSAVKDANFLAVNLDGLLDGHGSQRIFSKKDVGGMAVMSKETVAEELARGGKKK